jgi:hypothetical protein
MIIDSTKYFFKCLLCDCCTGDFEFGSKTQSRNGSGGERRVLHEHENNNQVHAIVQMNDDHHHHGTPSCSLTNSRRNLLEINAAAATDLAGMRIITRNRSPEVIRPRRLAHPIFEKLNDGMRHGSREFDLSLDNVEVEHIEIPREYLTKDWKAPAWKDYYSKPAAFSNKSSSSASDKVSRKNLTFRRSSSVGGDSRLSSSTTSHKTGRQAGTSSRNEPQPSTSSGRCQSEQHVGPSKRIQETATTEHFV